MNTKSILGWAERIAQGETAKPSVCTRCNTPKKCAIYGCCPNTWPDEKQDPAYIKKVGQ